MDVTVRINGFRNADASCKLWVSTHAGTWYNGASAFAIQQLAINPATLVSIRNAAPTRDESQPRPLLLYAADPLLCSNPVCARGQSANVTVLNVPSTGSSATGDVAAFALHDADEDGQPGSNWFGYPTEAVTATRGARGGPFGGPYWNDAKVALTGPCMDVEMSMWYP